MGSLTEPKVGQIATLKLSNIELSGCICLVYGIILNCLANL